MTGQDNNDSPDWVDLNAEGQPPESELPEELKPHPHKHFELKEPIGEIDEPVVNHHEHRIHLGEDSEGIESDRMHDSILEGAELESAEEFTGDWLGTIPGKILQFFFCIGLIGGGIWEGVRIWESTPGLAICIGIFVVLLVLVIIAGMASGEDSPFNWRYYGGGMWT